MQARKTRTTACYCLKTRKASAAITRFYDGILEPCGVTARQYSLLLNIYRSEQCSISELADLTELDRSTLSRSLKPLFNQNLIVDISLPRDRNSRLELTGAGREKVEQARLLWNEAQRQLKEKLGEEGLEALEKVVKLLGSF